MKIVSQKLRDSARGQDCTLRIPDVCNFNPDTTVLAHLPCGHRGVGMKSPDNMAIHACSDCHDAMDGRSPAGKIIDRDLLRALAETQLRWIESGLISIKGMR